MTEFNSARLLPGFSSCGWIADLFDDPLPNFLPPHYDSPMLVALRAAMRNNGLPSPNPTVGAVLICNNEIVGVSATEPWGKRHAEAVLCASRDDLRGHTLYTTLEPCSHQGKQGPCAVLLADRALSHCEIACIDPNPEVNRSGIERLEKSGCKVEVGEMAAEATAWHLPFLYQMKLSRRFIAAKWAQTLDGHWADDWGESKWISNPLSRRYAHHLRQRYDAIVVGASTVLNDHPNLDVRIDGIETISSPLKIIFDPQGRIQDIDKNKQSALLSSTFSKGSNSLYVSARDHNLWFCSDDHCFRKIGRDRGFSELAELLRSGDLPSPKPIQSIMVEGGPRLTSALIKEDAVDLFHVFNSPQILGAGRSRLGEDIAPCPIADARSLYPLCYFSLGGDQAAEFMSATCAEVFEASAGKA